MQNKRIVIQPSYSRNEPRYAHAYELDKEGNILIDHGCIAEAKYDIDELAEAWGKKQWKSGFSLVLNGIASTEVIEY